MHLLPDQDRVGVSSKNAFPELEWVEDPPAPLRAADGALYPLRALARLSERTAEEQERENRYRTLRRTKWDTRVLMQAALLSAAVGEMQLDSNQRRYVLHHYRDCNQFKQWVPSDNRLWAEMEYFSPRTREGLASTGISDIDHLMARLGKYFRTPRGATLAFLSIRAGPKGGRHSPHAYIYVSPGRADFEELWRELVELGGVDWGTEASGWGQDELKSLLERQEIMHPSNGQPWKALGVN